MGEEIKKWKKVNIWIEIQISSILLSALQIDKI